MKLITLEMLVSSVYLNPCVLAAGGGLRKSTPSVDEFFGPPFPLLGPELELTHWLFRVPSALFPMDQELTMR